MSFRYIKPKFRLKKISDEGKVIYKACNHISNLEHPIHEFNKGKWLRFELFIYDKKTKKYKLVKVFKKGEKINLSKIKW